jgi:NAD(P) transhydrogenase subunit alpha
VLVTADMVRSMDSGSVIVDLVAEQGGNCELTQACETIIRHDVTIIAPDNLASTVPYHASQMYANNITNFLLNLTKNGKADIGQFDLTDDIIRETMIIHDGQVTFSNVKK